MIKIPSSKDRNVAVFGLSRTGLASVKSLSLSGANVYAWDDREEVRGYLQELRVPKLHVKPPEEYDWENMDFLVLSPGIPLTHPTPHPIVQMAKDTLIICDIELLYYADVQAKFVGITGTNGKSTTTALIGHILKELDVKSEVGGNIGTAVLGLDKLGADGTYVLEMSSYQLDLIKQTKFDISVMLNISPDHLDRHGSMDGYINAKKHVFENQSEHDVAVISVDDEYTNAIYDELKSLGRIGKIIPISVKQHIEDGIYVNDGIIYDGDKQIKIGKLKNLAGKHNEQNIAAAYAVAKCLGCKSELVIKAIASFSGLPHRMQNVKEKNGVIFINDSKATNVDAAARALSTFDDIYWILGGAAKDGGISTLSEFFPKIKHAYLIGEAQDAFAWELEGKVEFSKCGDLAHAVAKSYEDSKNNNGGVLLLSPACASFDQWQSFEERGDAFCKMVEQL